jgi:hypothetical protein
VTICATVKVIAFIWLVGIFLSLPLLGMTKYEDALFYDGSPIKVCRTMVNKKWHYGYTIIIFCLFFVVPLFVLKTLYTCIIRKLMSDQLHSLAHNDQKAVKTIKSRKQVLQMLILIIVLFFVSLFPIRVFSLWRVFAPKTDLINLGLEAYLNLVCWVRILMYMNSTGNPIIYSLTSTKFKAAYTAILGSCSNRNVQGSVTYRQW